MKVVFAAVLIKFAANIPSTLVYGESDFPAANSKNYQPWAPSVAAAGIHTKPHQDLSFVMTGQAHMLGQQAHFANTEIIRLYHLRISIQSYLKFQNYLYLIGENSTCVLHHWVLGLPVIFGQNLWHQFNLLPFKTTYHLG